MLQAGKHPVDLRILSLLSELDRAAGERPQLILLDDLHYADAESLRALRLLVRRVHDRRVLLVVAARAGRGGSAAGRVEPELREALRSGLLRVLELAPLTEEASRRLVALVVGRSGAGGRPVEGIPELIEAVGGTPYFLIEMAPGLVERRGPFPDRVPPRTNGSIASTTSDPDHNPIPPAVRASILERCSELSRGDRRLVETAAWLGGQFDAEAVAAGTTESLQRTTRRLDSLTAGGWPLRLVDSMKHTYAFEHSLLHRVLLDAAPQPPLPELRRIVGWWSTHRRADPRTEARLRSTIEDRPGMLQCLERAVDDAIDEGAVRSVPGILRLGHTGTSGSLGSTELAHLYLRSAARLRALWERDALAQTLDGLLEIDPPVDISWTARCWRLGAEFVHDPIRVKRTVQELLARGPNGRPRIPGEARRLLTFLAALHAWTVPQRPYVKKWMARGLRCLDDGAHDFEMFHLLLTDAHGEIARGHWGVAQRRIEEARSVLRRGRLPAARLNVFLMDARASLAEQRGELDEALRIARRAVAQARRLGNPTVEAETLVALAIIEFDVRETAKSTGHLSEAEELSAKLDNAVVGPLCVALRGWCSIFDGDWDAARSAFERARRIGRDTGWPYVAWNASIGLGLTRAVQGDLPGAWAVFPERPYQTGPGAPFLTEYFCALAHIRECAGDLAAARTELGNAVRVARRSRHPTDLLEAYSQMAEWHRRHGTRQGAQHWDAAVRRVRRPNGIEGRAPWPGVASTNPQVTLQKGPRTRTLPEVEIARPSALRIIHFLQTRPHLIPPGPVGGASDAISEVEIASGLGLPRGSIARSVRRLRDRGILERSLARPRGGGRRVYLCRLAPVGRPS